MEYLTITEAAATLGLSDNQVYLRMRRRDLPYVIVGSRRMIRAADLVAYLAVGAPLSPARISAGDAVLSLDFF